MFSQNIAYWSEEKGFTYRKITLYRSKITCSPATVIAYGVLLIWINTWTRTGYIPYSSHHITYMAEVSVFKSLVSLKHQLKMSTYQPTLGCCGKWCSGGVLPIEIENSVTFALFTKIKIRSKSPILLSISTCLNSFPSESMVELELVLFTSTATIALSPSQLNVMVFKSLFLKTM